MLPFVLNLIARDQATTDRWAVAESTYREAIGLARESGQQIELAFGLAGLAWLQARRGRERECRAGAAEATRALQRAGHAPLRGLGDRALGELELGLGDAARRRRAVRAPAAAARRARDHRRRPLARPPSSSTHTSGSDAARTPSRRRRAPGRARARRGSRGRSPARFAAAGSSPMRRSLSYFEQALAHHALTPDEFEAARTRLAYGERLRRARKRVLAREQLRAAMETFERLERGPWADRAPGRARRHRRDARRRDPTTLDELTPQELQIALLLAAADHAGDRGGAVPQPEDDRVSPAPRLPEARHPLPRRVGGRCFGEPVARLSAAGVELRERVSASQPSPRRYERREGLPRARCLRDT